MGGWDRPRAPPGDRGSGTYPLSDECDLSRRCYDLVVEGVERDGRCRRGKKAVVGLESGRMLARMVVSVRLTARSQSILLAGWVEAGDRGCSVQIDCLIAKKKKGKKRDSSKPRCMLPK